MKKYFFEENVDSVQSAVCIDTWHKICGEKNKVGEFSTSFKAGLYNLEQFAIKGFLTETFDYVFSSSSFYIPLCGSCQKDQVEVGI